MAKERPLIQSLKLIHFKTHIKYGNLGEGVRREEKEEKGRVKKGIGEEVGVRKERRWG